MSPHTVSKWHDLNRPSSDPEVQTYLDQYHAVWRFIDPIIHIRRLDQMLDRPNLSKTDRERLNRRKRRLLDPRPKYIRPGTPTPEEASNLRARTVLYDINKLLDAANFTRPDGGYDDRE